MKKKVFSKLKPKAASLGFNDKELEGIAENISNNLGSEEVTDEQIDAQIDAAIPFLKVAQANANRVIEDNRRKATTQQQQQTTPATETPGEGNPKPDDEPAWAKRLREDIENKLSRLEADKVTNIRKSKIEALLKDTGAFGKSTLKAFEKMSFQSDQEFEEYVTEITDSIKEIDQERTNVGLGPLSKPIAGEQSSKEKTKKLTDAEVDEIVDSMG